MAENRTKTDVHGLKSLNMGVHGGGGFKHESADLFPAMFEFTPKNAGRITLLSTLTPEK